MKMRKGFSLVEIMMAVVAGSIVLLATGSVLISSQRSWVKSWEMANLQRSSSYALLRMTRSIKDGASAEVEDDGTAITIHRKDDWIRYSWPSGTNDLKCQVKGGQMQPILDGNLQSITFTLNGNKIGIDLKLQKDDLQNHFVSTVTMRNFGG